eukprot:gene10730-2820_t
MCGILERVCGCVMCLAGKLVVEELALALAAAGCRRCRRRRCSRRQLHHNGKPRREGLAPAVFVGVFFDLSPRRKDHARNQADQVALTQLSLRVDTALVNRSARLSSRSLSATNMSVPEISDYARKEEPMQHTLLPSNEVSVSQLTSPLASSSIDSDDNEHKICRGICGSGREPVISPSSLIPIRQRHTLWDDCDDLLKSDSTFSINSKSHSRSFVKKNCTSDRNEIAATANQSDAGNRQNSSILTRGRKRFETRVRGRTDNFFAKDSFGGANPNPSKKEVYETRDNDDWKRSKYRGKQSNCKRGHHSSQHFSSDTVAHKSDTTLHSENPFPLQVSPTSELPTHGMFKTSPLTSQSKILIEKDDGLVSNSHRDALKQLSLQQLATKAARVMRMAGVLADHIQCTQAASATLENVTDSLCESNDTYRSDLTQAGVSLPAWEDIMAAMAATDVKGFDDLLHEQMSRQRQLHSRKSRRHSKKNCVANDSTCKGFKEHAAEKLSSKQSDLGKKLSQKRAKTQASASKEVRNITAEGSKLSSATAENTKGNYKLRRVSLTSMLDSESNDRCVDVREKVISQTDLDALISKHPLPNANEPPPSVNFQGNHCQEITKRGRGRPRKHPVPIFSEHCYELNSCFDCHELFESKTAPHENNDTSQSVRCADVDVKTGLPLYYDDHPHESERSQRRYERKRDEDTSDERFLRRHSKLEAQERKNSLYTNTPPLTPSKSIAKGSNLSSSPSVYTRTSTRRSSSKSQQHTAAVPAPIIKSFWPRLEDLRDEHGQYPSLRLEKRNNLPVYSFGALVPSLPATPFRLPTRGLNAFNLPT